jgi:hypothetical protein
VRGRKNRRKAINQAPRNPATSHQTKLRRRWLIPPAAGPTVGKPAAGAAFEVPTAGVPTNFAASPPPDAAVFAASGFGLAVFDSGAAMPYLLNTLWSKLCGGREQCRRFPPLNVSPCALRSFRKAQKSFFALSPGFVFSGTYRSVRGAASRVQAHRNTRGKPGFGCRDTQARRGLWKRLWPAEFVERGNDTS